MLQGRDLGDETDRSGLDAVIARLAALPRQGASYDHMGKHGWSNPVRADTGMLLTALTIAAHPVNVLEIGSAHGESMCHIAKGAPNAKLTTIEWLPELAAEAQANFLEAGINVEVCNGDALEIIPKFKNRFGLVFLDANKSGYGEQFLLLKKHHLLMPGCTIIADNVIDRQTECQDFLNLMMSYNHIVLSTECGLLVATI